MIINEAYHLGSYWKEDKTTTGTYLDRVYQYLSRLLAEFKHYDLMIIGDQGEVPFPDNPEEFKTYMLPIIYNEDAWYIDKEGNRSTEIHLNSVCDSGFYSQYNLEKGNELIQINIRGGCHRVKSPEGYTYGSSMPNSVIMYFPTESLSTIDFISLKHIFLYTIKAWQPENAFVVSDEFLDETYDQENDFQIGWLNYFNDFPKEIPLPEDVDYEAVEKGVLISLIKKIPESTSAELVNKGLTIKNILNQFDMLNWKEEV